MKRPEKKETKNINYSNYPIDFIYGYNQSCDDWEQYHNQEMQKRIDYESERDKVILNMQKTIDNLPSEDEIHRICMEIYKQHGFDNFVNSCSKAIHKRLRGEK